MISLESYHSIEGTNSKSSLIETEAGQEKFRFTSSTEYSVTDYLCLPESIEWFSICPETSLLILNAEWYQLCRWIYRVFLCFLTLKKEKLGTLGKGLSNRVLWFAKLTYAWGEDYEKFWDPNMKCYTAGCVNNHLIQQEYAKLEKLINKTWRYCHHCYDWYVSYSPLRGSYTETLLPWEISNGNWQGLGSRENTLRSLYRPPSTNDHVQCRPDLNSHCLPGDIRLQLYQLR